MTFYDLCFKYSVCVDLHEYKSKLLGVNCEFPLGIRHVIFFPQLRSASERGCNCYATVQARRNDYKFVRTSLYPLGWNRVKVEAKTWLWQIPTVPVCSAGPTVCLSHKITIYTLQKSAFAIKKTAIANWQWVNILSI